MEHKILLLNFPGWTGLKKDTIYGHVHGQWITVDNWPRPAWKKAEVLVSGRLEKKICTCISWGSGYRIFLSPMNQWPHFNAYS